MNRDDSVKVAMMQPTFLPWLGYFELIAKSEIFVFLDDFQFVYRSYHQKNRLFTSKNKVDWYIVPVNKQESFQKPLNQAIIKDEIPWRRKACKRIEANYQKATYYSVFQKDIMELLSYPERSLLAQNIKIIKYVCDVLGYKTDMIYSSDIKKSGKRSELIKSILEELGADIYLSSNGSFQYMYEDNIFPVKNVEILFQNYRIKEYEQIGGSDFFPYLSVIDALFNIGAEKTRELINNGTDKWLDWNEMVMLEFCGQ